MQQPDEPSMYVLEPPTPLSRSMVWRLQRTFYGDQGIGAWSQSHVPQAITTSPNIARAYARMVQSFWSDLHDSLDLSQPLYVLELGAGSGRFAYRFLKAIASLLEQAPEPRPRLVYVMTDAIPSVVDFWRTNPRLRPFVEAGMLDFAHFDLVECAPITLQNAGTVLEPGTLANPLVVLGNYIFDTIPQDALTIKDGQFFANLVEIRASTPELDLTAPDSRVRIGLGFSQETLPTDVDSEPDPVLRDVLRDYLQRDRLEGTTLVIPRAGVATLRFFHTLSGGRLLCVAADIGESREEELAEHGTPGFGAGGGLWLAVNFHALGEYVQRLGGFARHPRGLNLVLNISMLLLGPPGAAFEQTQQAYTDSIDVHGPDEIALIGRALADRLPELKLEELIALLRATGWDTDYLSRSVPVLLEKLSDAEDRLRHELLRGVFQAWDHYYPIGETDDVPFGVGVLLYSLEQYPQALEFFERSLRDFGEDPRTTLNLALTLYRMERLQDALHWLDRTLELDPTNELAQKMRPDVAADLQSARGQAN